MHNSRTLHSMYTTESTWRDVPCPPPPAGPCLEDSDLFKARNHARNRQVESTASSTWLTWIPTFANPTRHLPVASGKGDKQWTSPGARGGAVATLSALCLHPISRRPALSTLPSQSRTESPFLQFIGSDAPIGLWSAAAPVPISDCPCCLIGCLLVCGRNTPVESMMFSALYLARAWS
ncbi:hypothetical protein P171DRAFT_106233 [Karstenula rhodostoma CBS 690.94]|uniref:Uncharacterized protein n=1 Tax=Karstenula rhodostoma CBS 690.94 TaxID=1392251 RepID=A0A9P4PC60_9PLEO|nr:hypothetical protein P171DRAFT_106233 [Karstenula rhodostoma CBS 690.94]